MKNIIISLLEELITWAKLQATRRARSFSRWVQKLILRERENSANESDTLAAFLALKPRQLKYRPSKREEIYDRPVLRRH